MLGSCRRDERVTAIAAGYAHSLALKKDGSVVAWGCGSSSVLNFATDRGQCTVPPGLPTVTAIAGGQSQSLALTK